MPAKLAALVPDVQPLGILDDATLNHLHLNVADLDIAQEFYERHFGWEPVTEFGTDRRKMRFLRDKRGFSLVLEKHPDRTPMPSWFHLGFEVPDRDDVQVAIDYFKREKVKVLDPPVMTDRYASVTIEDADGYHLQVYWDAPQDADH